MLSDHVIVCGYGLTSKAVLRELVRNEVSPSSIIVIERDRDLMDTLSDTELIALNSDATSQSALLEAGVKKASWLFISTNEDDTNALIVLTARELAPNLLIIVRLNRFRNRKLYERIGVDVMVHPSIVGDGMVAVGWFGKRVSQVITGKDAEVIAGYDEVIDTDETHRSAYYGRGLAMITAKRGISPDDLEERIRRVNPDPGLALRAKGEVYIKLGDFDRAGQIFNRCLKEGSAAESDLDRSRLWSLLGVATTLGGDMSLGQEYYEKALELNQYNRDAIEGLGMNLVTMERYEDAREAYEVLLQMHPNDPKALFNIASTLMLEDRHDEAVQGFLDVLSLNRKNFQAWYYLGVTLLAQQKEAEAVTSLKAALELEPTSLEAWVQKGLAHERLGQSKELMDCMEHVLLIKPDDTFALDKLREVKTEISFGRGSR